MIAWQHTLERAQDLAQGREAIRLTNLAIACAIATGHREPLDGGALEHEVHSLAVGEPIVASGGLLDWQALADEARTAARGLLGPDGHDRWVRAFQSADPARKSRGAYATPRTLARPMARMLLRGRGAATRIVDPSAGGGALLLATFHEIAGRRPSPERAACAVSRLHGVELDPVARELCCLQLWLAAAGAAGIRQIGQQILEGNAITFDWASHAPYDAVIMNPPWDSLRHVDHADDEERRRTIGRLETQEAGGDLPPLFSHQGRGDRNLYKAFVELAPHLIREHGRIIALVPGAWSSDLGTKDLRNLYVRHTSIDQWTSLENRRGYFPIDGRYKFGILAARRDRTGTTTLRTLGMADDIRQLKSRHVRLPADTLETIGGPARIIPDLTSNDEAALLRKIRANGSPFFDPHSQLGTVRYDREIDLTEDRKRGLFERLEDLEIRRTGPATWTTAEGRRLKPLLEGRMVGQYDFMEKSWISGQGRRAVWTYNNGDELETCQPQFLASPARSAGPRVAICDVTSATNTRTVLAAWVPESWPCGNTAPVLVFATQDQALAALAVLNSMVFDWQARRIVSGLHLNKFYLQAMSWPVLADGQVADLAAAARQLLSLQPRFRAVAPELAVASKDVDYVAAHQTIEGIVAAGYSLGPGDLEQLYDRGAHHRRGFWRHYASDPIALDIVDSVLAAELPVVEAGA
jgi:hypothetical protein